MAGKSKGSNFERSICTRLSIWWDGNDDTFWRTHGSGARATSRMKRGKKTHGQDGDICAVNPTGSILTDIFSFELKRGYSKETLMDFLDGGSNTKQRMWEGWISQAVTSWENSGAFSWMIITQRDRHLELCIFPRVMFRELQKMGAELEDCHPKMFIETWFRRGTSPDSPKTKINLACILFDDFLGLVFPEHIKNLSKRV